MSRAIAYRPTTGAKDDRFYMIDYVNQKAADEAKRWFAIHNLNIKRKEDPCAGNGEMTRHFPGTDAFDLNPEPNNYGVKIKQRDFLLHTQDYEPGLLMIMNVPYGYQSSAAIAFFNKAAPMCDYMLIVVPLTWERGIYNNRLNEWFHKVESYALPPNAFYLPDNNNKVHDVPSVMQLWVRKDYTRQREIRRLHSDIVEVRRNVGNALKRTPLAAIRRHGLTQTSATEVITSGFDRLTKDNYFYIFAKHGMEGKIITALNHIDWLPIASTNMSQPGINKTQVITEIERYLLC